MFDISNALKIKIESYSEQERLRAEEKCEQAHEYLQMASDTKENREHLINASELYIEAAKIYPKLTEPYLVLAYIFAIYEEYDKSIKLINRVIEIDPLNMNARNMLRDYQDKSHKYEFLAKVRQVNKEPLLERIKPKTDFDKGLSFFKKILQKFSLDKGEPVITKSATGEKITRDDFLNDLEEIKGIFNDEMPRMVVHQDTFSKMKKLI